MERESWGKEGRGKWKGQSRVVWSPAKFVLGVRRTTNGVARSMNINITFLLTGATCLFSVALFFEFLMIHTFDRIPIYPSGI